MKCLVCPEVFDHEKPIVHDPAHLVAPFNMSLAEAERVARVKRATEQSAWEFVRLLLGNRPLVEGHVCPAHANAHSLTLAPVVSK